MRAGDMLRLLRKGGRAIAALADTRASAAEGVPIELLDPAALPLPASRGAREINRLTVGWQIRRALARRGMQRPVLWTSLPTGIVGIGAFETAGIVYYCGDDFAGLHGVDHVPVAELERELVDRADLIIAASEAIASRFPAAKTIIVPHGVDLDLFTSPAPRAADLPAGRHVAGYYGSISEWLDFELLATAARECPEWMFVMIGPIRCDVSPLAGLANVRFLEPKPHRELPRYVQHWTVSLMPFRAAGHVPAGNPLKLREYLAAGPPILATTASQALDGYSDLIEVIDGPNAIRAALARAASDHGRNALRRDRVAGEGWPVRADQVSQALRVLTDIGPRQSARAQAH